MCPGVIDGSNYSGTTVMPNVNLDLHDSFSSVTVKNMEDFQNSFNGLENCS